MEFDTIFAMYLECVKLKEFASEPVRKTDGSAGLDLASAYDLVIPPGETRRVETEIAIKLPENCCGLIAARSSFSFENKTTILGGIIDKDYTGGLVVQILNHAVTPLKISAGDRVAQLICLNIEYPTPLQVNHLPETERGAAGFGSTGKN